MEPLHIINPKKHNKHAHIWRQGDRDNITTHYKPKKHNKHAHIWRQGDRDNIRIK